MMATRYSNGMFVSDRVLNCSAALEAFDRSASGNENSKFKTRLNRCAELAGDPFSSLVGNVDAWTEAIRLERDDVAHHYGRRPSNDVGRQHDLWQSLYFLFVLCMLRKSDCPHQAIEHLERHAEYVWLSSRIQAWM